jgi:hypothetical protein
MSIKKLETSVNTLYSYKDKKDVVSLQVSKSAIGWHIQHSLLVIERVITQIQQSVPVEYKAGFNFKRLIVFTLDKIPRGTGKAPKAVQPQGEITLEIIEANYTIAIQKISELSSLQPKQFFNHHIFGKLKTSTTIKFLSIHTKHHLNIVNDILVKQ